MSRFILVVQVHDGKDRIHAGRSTHKPDTPQDPPVDFLYQDVYWCETSLQIAEFPCLSEIWMREIHQWVGHWSKDVRTAFGTHMTHQKGHRRKFVNIFRFFSFQVESGLTICLRMLNWLGKKWSGSIESISRSWFQTELQYGRPWVNTMNSTCGTVGMIGWVSMDGLISMIQREIMISMDGKISEMTWAVGLAWSNMKTSVCSSW